MTFLVTPGDLLRSNLSCSLKLWLSKGSFRPPTVKVKPFGFLAKTFFLLLEIFSGKKLFAGNLDTSPPARSVCI